MQRLQMGLQSFLDQILFVIVLYKRRPEESESFRSLWEMKEYLPEGSIFIFDNSPTNDSGAKSSALHDNRIIYTHSPENPGVSRAYNTAARLASSLDKKWLLLFDQDTRFRKTFLEKLFEATSAYAGSGAFVPIVRDSRGMVSPFRWSMGRGWRMEHCAESLPLAKYRFINSGLMIQRDDFHKAGGYDEGIPLDFSDIAFGERLGQLNATFRVVDDNVVTSFSGSSKPSAENALARFRFFCEGGFKMATIGPRYFLLFNMLVRTLSLCLRFRTFDFIRIFFSSSNGPSASNAHQPSTMPYEQ